MEFSGRNEVLRVSRTTPTIYSSGTRSGARSFLKNAILARLPPPALAAMGGLFEPIVLRERMALQEAKRQPDHVYFIESGLVSLRVVGAGSILEMALI